VRVTEIKAINLNDLDSRIDMLLRDKKVKEDNEGIKINLSDLGYDKLLGSGQIKHKMIIEAKSFSKNAVKKLEEIGGKAVTVN
jgi:large subunit ribosomal protein L15